MRRAPVGIPESEAVRPDDGANRQALPEGGIAALPDWFMPFVRRTFANHAGGHVLRWLELCDTKGKITAQPLTSSSWWTASQLGG